MSIPEIIRLNSKPTKIFYDVQATPYGDMMIGLCDEGICWAGFDLGGKIMRKRFPEAQFIEAKNVNVNKSLAVFGTDFQLLVWKSLCDINRGDTITYGGIASNINLPKAYRAVGTAVGANPISGFIPCHRVLPAQGGVGNYLWGSEKKADLLKQEQINP